MAIADDIEKVGLQFNKYFGMYGRQFKVFIDIPLTALTRKVHFDIIKFDDWLHQQGYNEGVHGSMKNYITDAYGKDATTFIENLIGHKGE